MTVVKESVALVTGGASGLGLAVVQKLLKAGAKVGVFDLPSPENEARVAELAPGAIFCPVDVSQEEAVKSGLAKLEGLGALRIAVNCAGIAFAIKTLQRERAHDLASFQMTQQVNLIGTFNICRLAAERMAQNSPNSDGERGVLINTASIAAFEGQIGQIAYAASKGGIVAMTLPMARDLSKVGIRVMCIAPGIFDTPLLAKLPEPARQALAEQVPFPHRLGQSEEFAALALHIVANPMLNGEVIRLDGALRMSFK